jgi:hypothetical protein
MTDLILSAGELAYEASDVSFRLFSPTNPSGQIVGVGFANGLTINGEIVTDRDTLKLAIASINFNSGGSTPLPTDLILIEGLYRIEVSNFTLQSPSDSWNFPNKCDIWISFTDNDGIDREVGGFLYSENGEPYWFNPVCPIYLDKPYSGSVVIQYIKDIKCNAQIDATLEIENINGYGLYEVTNRENYDLLSITDEVYDTPVLLSADTSKFLVHDIILEYYYRPPSLVIGDVYRANGVTFTVVEPQNINGLWQLASFATDTSIVYNTNPAGDGITATKVSGTGPSSISVNIRTVYASGNILTFGSLGNTADTDPLVQNSAVHKAIRDYTTAIPAPPPTGTYTLRVVDGVLSWI